MSQTVRPRGRREPDAHFARVAALLGRLHRGNREMTAVLVLVGGQLCDRALLPDVLDFGAPLFGERVSRHWSRVVVRIGDLGQYSKVLVEDRRRL